MRIMPFTPAVYDQLINAGFTHLLFTHFNDMASGGEEKRPVILEVAMHDIPQVPNMLPLHSDEVKSFPLSTTTKYYIRSKNISGVIDDDRSYLLSFTKAEATELQYKYQSLLNKPFMVQGQQLGTISCVTAAPFDEINKWIFFQFYTSCKDSSKALAHYNVPYYDVLVIGMLYGTNEHVSESLLAYLRNNNMQAADLPKTINASHPALAMYEA